MTDYEFHPRQTGSREQTQPWGRHEVEPYTPEEEALWLAHIVENAGRKKEEWRRQPDEGDETVIEGDENG